MDDVITEKFFVYKHTNIFNNNAYIGVTGRETPETRWGNGGVKYKYNKHFWNAICKYGWDNFKHEILFDNLTKEEAYQKEIELIAFYKSNDPKFGYNNSAGGEFSHLGCKHDEETKKKMSKNHADFKGANSVCSIKIICLDTKEIYNSIGEAGRKLNIDHRGILNVLKHKAKSTHGLHFEYLKDYDPNKEYDLSVGHTEESYKKISEAKKDKSSWNKGKKHSSASIEKMRLAHKGSISPMKGKTHTPQAREKLRLANLGKKISQETRNRMSEAQKHVGCKKVICIETGQIFESIAQCSKSIGVTKSRICRVCKQNKGTINNLHFQYYIGDNNV